jgi:Zn-dependent protease/CBS domain-containing protein
MGRQKISLGRILGIPIGLDYSWFLVFILLTWTLAVSYYPAEFKNWPVVEYWLVGAVTAIMLFVSVLLHELGHSVIAMRYKIPVRSITLFIFGGVAQIGAEPPSAMAEFWIAIAGPVVSFALAIFFGLLQPVLTPIAPLLALAKYLAYINGILALFNLIPGFPLDGGRVFRAIVWGMTQSLYRATVIAGNVGRFIGFLFIFYGVWQMFGGNLINGLWIAFIGWFLESAAIAQIQQQRIQGLLTGHRVSEVMSRAYTAISADTTLQQLIDHHILSSGRRSFIVEREEEAIGLLTVHHIKEIPREQWETTTAAQVMTPVVDLKRIQPDTEMWTAVQEMDRNGVNQLPVMTNGHVKGMLTREDVISYLRTLQELNM